jgi:hypothetical protein
VPFRAALSVRTLPEPIGSAVAFYFALNLPIAKETKRRFDGDAAPAFSLQVRKGMTANFLDIKWPFS